MYTLRSIARRGMPLVAAFAMVVAATIPSAAVFADALNPLTERSLMLSSSAPGYMDTDGSGNPTYAPAGSGPNGKKTGQTFSFKVSSTATVNGFSLQYCMTAAGECQAPGNNGGDYDPNDDGTYTDSTRPLNETAVTGGWANSKSDLNIVGTFANAADETPDAGEFAILQNGNEVTGWTMTTMNAESENTALADLELTGKNNMIHLVNTGGGPALTAGDTIQIIFKPSDTVYITNPGDRAFFVKINTYSSSDTADFIPTVPYESNSDIIDGGVTVANVMTDSIHITTKVLETMSFSVGTRNRDTVDLGTGSTHGKCDPIQQINNNRLDLGNPSAEYSLETDQAYDVYSYWRLSSNSSGGATVYYSGETLANTVGDRIADMPNEIESTPGTEQFGLGFVDAGDDTLDDGSADAGNGVADWAAGYQAPRSYPFRTLADQTAAPYDTLDPQDASDDYDEAEGTINGAQPGDPGDAKFKFLRSSLTIPEVIAQQDEQVISCATAKMRYVANIGADTPAGVYTTKINYLAAPQY